MNEAAARPLASSLRRKLFRQRVFGLPMVNSVYGSGTSGMLTSSSFTPGCVPVTDPKIQFACAFPAFTVSCWVPPVLSPWQSGQREMDQARRCSQTVENVGQGTTSGQSSG